MIRSTLALHFWSEQLKRRKQKKNLAVVKVRVLEEDEEMNGVGGGGGVGEETEKVVLMWGYLPGVSPQRSPVLSPAAVPLPESYAEDRWRDVCGGGCGFAMAVSESGKLFTWGSTDDMGQSYVASGKHKETPESFPLPEEVKIVSAAAGWAHCVAVTAYGEVYTWGWKECVPSGKVVGDQSMGGNLEKDDRESTFLNEQVSPTSHISGTSSGMVSTYESRTGEGSTKRRRVSSAKHGPETSTSGDETLSAPPCLVTLNAGVRIAAVAAGGRHTLALSDAGQVWGWGYGGEGQLGLGSRIRMISSPHPVPCVESASYSRERSSSVIKGSTSSEGRACKVAGSCVKAIACGGRHSAVVTDTGAILTFGWGLYGQV
ncbi:uncharacterized protein M6B38_275235 [Iris pallida]|uniref:Ultraviolet-B receptor UVR8 n=1 Tax=Iris pallida TaxID=29817 RepID=A0AAX6I5I0_IRIPA|nr:uncharacterized protein M6B38_275235 [Iris pallida]